MELFVLNFIRDNPGLRTSQVIEKSGFSSAKVEDAIWTLWKVGKIQINPDSTLRLPREGEMIFRYDT